MADSTLKGRLFPILAINVQLHQGLLLSMCLMGRVTCSLIPRKLLRWTFNLAPVIRINNLPLDNLAGLNNLYTRCHKPFIYIHITSARRGKCKLSPDVEKTHPEMLKIQTSPTLINGQELFYSKNT